MGIVLKGLRSNTMVRGSLALALVCALGCGDDTPSDNGPADAGVGTLDSGNVGQWDASPPFPTPGFGAITGDCDVLDDELTSAEPSLIVSAFDFAQGYSDSELGELSQGGQQIIADGNAGGSSVLSEVFAFELLRRCEQASLLKTETQIVYTEEGKLTDFLAEIDSMKIGVSVTRAVAFPFDDPYELSQASELLASKLADILESSANVSAEDRWNKQILSILAYAPEHAEILQEAWTALDAKTRADTVVHIIVTNGDDDFIYCNGACP